MHLLHEGILLHLDSALRNDAKQVKGFTTPPRLFNINKETRMRGEQYPQLSLVLLPAGTARGSAASPHSIQTAK